MAWRDGVAAVSGCWQWGKMIAQHSIASHDLAWRSVAFGCLAHGKTWGIIYVFYGKPQTCAETVASIYQTVSQFRQPAALPRRTTSITCEVVGLCDECVGQGRVGSGTVVRCLAPANLQPTHAWMNGGGGDEKSALAP